MNNYIVKYRNFRAEVFGFFLNKIIVYCKKIFYVKVKGRSNGSFVDHLTPLKLFNPLLKKTVPDKSFKFIKYLKK